MLLATLLPGLEVALPLMHRSSLSIPAVFALLSVLARVGAFIARFASQKGISDRNASPSQNCFRTDGSGCGSLGADAQSGMTQAAKMVGDAVRRLSDIMYRYFENVLELT